MRRLKSTTRADGVAVSAAFCAVPFEAGRTTLRTSPQRMANKLREKMNLADVRIRFRRLN